MGIEANIGPRGRAILTAVVETYISTGEPVGSKTIAQAGGEQWSAATIRNVMADLADAGYLDQPHTSAGRIPTAEAYRYYVEQLTGKARLSQEDEGKIDSMLAGASDVQEFMERTSRVLSLVSSGVGVAISSTGARNTLEHVHFSRLGDHRILAVVVTKSGLVRDRVLRLQHDMQQADLEVAARYINDNFRGWNMEDLRAELLRRIEIEDVAPHLRNLVLIGAPARANGEVVGSFAVLGPTRMDYEHTITAVSHIARLFDHILNEGDEAR